jgi:hypothetical protein
MITVAAGSRIAALKIKNLTSQVSTVQARGDARPSGRVAATGRSLGGQVTQRNERQQDAAEEKPGPGLVTARQFRPGRTS